MSQAPIPTPTGGSAALSLVELRRHLIRRASALTVRARAHRLRGDRVAAARLEEQATRLREVAKDMRSQSRRM
jgi:hypothetical protein